MEVWAYQYGVQLDFIRPGSPVENGYIESFNGRLRDECRCGRTVPWGIAPQRCLRNNGQDRGPRSERFRSGGKIRNGRDIGASQLSPWSTQIAGQAGPNRITQSVFSTSGRSEFAGQVMEVAALACYLHTSGITRMCGEDTRSGSLPAHFKRVSGYDAAESASKMSYDRLPRFLRCD